MDRMGLDNRSLLCIPHFQYTIRTPRAIHRKMGTQEDLAGSIHELTRQVSSHVL